MANEKEQERLTKELLEKLLDGVTPADSQSRRPLHLEILSFAKQKTDGIKELIGAEISLLSEYAKSPELDNHPRRGRSLFYLCNTIISNFESMSEKEKIQARNHAHRLAVQLVNGETDKSTERRAEILALLRLLLTSEHPGAGPFWYRTAKYYELLPAIVRHLLNADAITDAVCVFMRSCQIFCKSQPLNKMSPHECALISTAAVIAHHSASSRFVLRHLINPAYSKLRSDFVDYILQRVGAADPVNIVTDKPVSPSTYIEAVEKGEVVVCKSLSRKGRLLEIEPLPEASIYSSLGDNIKRTGGLRVSQPHPSSEQQIVAAELPEKLRRGFLMSNSRSKSKSKIPEQPAWSTSTLYSNKKGFQTPGFGDTAVLTTSGHEAR
jgi:hypothetical protein